MAEKSIFSARAVVYYFDVNTKGWVPTPAGNGFCVAQMFENSASGTYRVIARALANTSQVVINSNVTKDTQYTAASDTFGKWSDSRYIYGLNFASQQEADTFLQGFQQVVTKLSGGGGGGGYAAPPPPPPAAASPRAPPAAPAAPPAAPAAPPAAPRAPPAAPAAPPAAPRAPPAAPAAPPAAPPAPPAAPPAPPAAPAAPASSPPASGERGALLDSIQGFKLGGLKKAVTVDKSGPVLKAEPAPPSGGGGGGAPKGGGGAPIGGGGGGGDMMAQIMAKRKAMQGGGGNASPTPAAPKATPAPAAPAPKMPPPAVPKAAPAAPAPAAPKATLAPPGAARRDSIPKNLQSGINKAAISTPPGAFTQQDLDNLRAEIMEEVRQQIQAFKNEILAALQPQ